MFNRDQHGHFTTTEVDIFSDSLVELNDTEVASLLSLDNIRNWTTTTNNLVTLYSDVQE